MQKIIFFTPYYKLFHRYRPFYYLFSLKTFNFYFKPCAPKLMNINTSKERTNYKSPFYRLPKVVYSVSIASLLKFFGLSDENEDSELIQILKRAELSYMKKDYDKSEQLLHLALKIAQELQNENAITYIYDRLANIAFHTNKSEKAKKLFIEVMNRLFQKGIAEDDFAIIHISFKLAKIFESLQDYQSAAAGYEYCFKRLKPRLSEPDNEKQETKAFFKNLLNGYAYFQYNLGKLDKALKIFLKTFEINEEINGEVHEENVLLLNNIGTIYKHKGNIELALSYFHRAEKIGKLLPDVENFSFIYLNLAYCYMEKGLYSESKNYCIRAKNNAERHKYEEGLKEAESCLVKIHEELSQEKK